MVGALKYNLSKIMFKKTPKLGYVLVILIFIGSVAILYQIQLIKIQDKLEQIGNHYENIGCSVIKDCFLCKFQKKLKITML